MPVPEGYIVYIFVNQLPGILLNDFQRRDAAERQMIRDAFKISYQ